MYEHLLANDDQEIACSKALSKLTISKSLYESLIDCVAFQLAGPSYIKTMKDYVYEPAVTQRYPGARSRRLVWNKNFFLGSLLRASVCMGFVDRLKSILPSSLIKRSGFYFEKIKKENEIMLKEFRGNNNVSQKSHMAIKQCLDCAKDVGAYIGSTMARKCENLFKTIFVSMEDTSFATDEGIVKALSKGKVMTMVEPRKILDACCELAARSRKPFWAAGLYSLAFNKYESRQERAS